MRESDRDRAREVLLEAFAAGWQAGLARTIRDPRAMAVVEGCFDLWLAEAVDEAEVLGFVFRGREDLPPPADAPAFVVGTPIPAVAEQEAAFWVADRRDGPRRPSRRTARATRPA